MSDAATCYEPLGGDNDIGMVMCILPTGHEGDHDGGEAERQLGENYAAQRLEDWLEREVW